MTILAALSALCLLSANAAVLRQQADQPVTQRDAVEAAEKLEPSTTPVKKVVELLEGLEKQVESEGQTEAAEYDKFACFCKEQADQKLYQIEKSDEKIDALTAAINLLESEIADLNKEVADLVDEIEVLDGKIETEKKKRADAHDIFLENDAKLAKAIETVAYALKALRGSRDEINFAQLQAVTDKAIALLPTNEKSTMTRHRAKSALMKVLQPAGEPADYKYHSSEVIEVLMDLHDQFAKTKKDLFDSEHEKRVISDKQVLGWTNERNFKDKDKTEKAALADEKTTDKHQKDKDKASEVKDRDSDTAFNEELTTQCHARADEWDQRSKARADEIQALAEAVEVLKTGVAANYEANSKLVGFQKHSAVRVAPKGNTTARKAHISSPSSFFQLRGNSVGAASTDAIAAVQRALQQLDSAAERIRSPRISALVMKAGLQIDHFAKVRGLINDLIKRLEDEALAEADQKSFCDKAIGDAVTKRDEQQMEVETQAATISEKEAAVAQMTQEIAELAKGIAELNHALNEATELRLEEKAANAKTIAMAEDGLTGIDEAIRILSAYYELEGGDSAGGADGSAALAQLSRAPAPAPAGYERYRAPGSDREGKTVGDLAPGMSYEGEYEGKVESSGGIVGLLTVIKADFERTIQSTTEAESAAKGKFEEFEGETKESIGTKQDSKTEKEGDISTAEDDITTAKDLKVEAGKLHALALEELEKLTASCVEGSESYEERAKKREQEVEALKEALQILEDFNK